MAFWKIKDILFPSPQTDFYACVQAVKQENSPHGKETQDPNKEIQEPIILGKKYMPRATKGIISGKKSFGPFY